VMEMELTEVVSWYETVASIQRKRAEKNLA
jgi:hypothetical protein